MQAQQNTAGMGSPQPRDDSCGRKRENASTQNPSLEGPTADAATNEAGAPGALRAAAWPEQRLLARGTCVWSDPPKGPSVRSPSRVPINGL